MLRPLLFLALLISVLRVQAKEPDRLDSLWQAHGDPQATTHERLLTLHELVLAMRSVDQDSSLVLSRNLLAQAKDARDTLMIALGYRDIGLAFLMMRSSVPSLTYLDSSLVFYSSRNDSAYLAGAGAVESNKAFAYRKLGRMDESMEHNRRSIALHRRANNEEGIVYCYNDMGLTFQFQGQPDSALVYYQKCADLAEKLGMQGMAGGAYGNMGNVYLGIGRIGEAIDMTYKSLAILERAHDQTGVAACLTTISEMKAAMGDNEESLQLLLRAYALYKAADHRQGMMTAGSSIGGRLMELGRPDSAVTMLENALALERGADVKDLMGRTLLSLGTVYRLTGRTADASRVLLEAVALAQELDDAASEAMARAALGRVELDLGRPGRALAQCTKGLALSERNPISAERQHNCECLYLAYKATGKGMLALKYHETFVSISDSLTSEKSLKQLTQRDMMHTFGKKQLADSLRFAGERKQLESERTIEALRADTNRNRALAIGIGGLLLLGGSGAWFVADRKRRRERFEKEAATLETQALRSQMNPHFIFNALNSINAFVQRNDQDSASSFLGKFARVMRLVLENSRHAEVPLKDDLEALRGYLDLERMRMGKKFDFSITVDPELDPEDVMVPPLVVQPFVENAIWHGMAGKEGGGHIDLRVARHGGQLRWTIEDNGSGRNAPKAPPAPGAPTKKTSLGTAITRARLDLVQKQHGGKARFHYTDLAQGTRVEVDMPLLSAFG